MKWHRFEALYARCDKQRAVKPDYARYAVEARIAPAAPIQQLPPLFENSLSLDIPKSY